MNENEDIERYTDLPIKTRQMLESLRPDEIEFLQRLIHITMSFGTVGRFVALIGGAVIGLTIGLPMLIDAIIRILSWFPSKVG